MNLELVAAQSFMQELHKIANSNADEGTKEAAASLIGEMTAEEVESFLKEAGFGAMLGGVAKGLGGLASGAARGAGSMVAGGAKGLVGAAGNAVSAAGRGIANAAGNAASAVKGTVQRAGSAVAAAPGALGQKMTNMGQAAQTRLTSMGNSMANAGAAKGQALQSRLAGPRAAPLNPISKPVGAVAPAAAPAQAGNALDALARLNGPEDGAAPRLVGTAAPPASGVRPRAAQTYGAGGLAA